jgi:hypothetical protein
MKLFAKYFFTSSAVLATQLAFGQGSHALYQDIFIPANANCVLSPAPSLRGATNPARMVFAGKLDAASQKALMAVSKLPSGKTSRQTTLTLALMVPPSPAGGPSGNNLKQLTLAVHSYVLIGLLRNTTDGNFQEHATYRLISARIDRLPSSAGSPNGVKITFKKLEPAPRMSRTEGGLWRGTGGG